jgi:hypothetical protein
MPIGPQVPAAERQCQQQKQANQQNQPSGTFPDCLLSIGRRLAL